MNKTQKGFALVEGLLIILILAIIGFGGYYVWNSQKNVDKTSNDAVSASQSPSSSNSSSPYLIIKEYRVKFQLSDKIKDAYYVKGSSGYYYFSLHRFDTLKGAEGCAANSDVGTSGLVALIAAKVGENTGAPAGGTWTQSDLDSSGLKKVGDTYYGFERGNAPCFDIDHPPTPDFQDTISNYIKAFSDQISTFTNS